MGKYTETLHDLLNNEDVKKKIEQALSTYPMYNPIHKELYGFIPSREELNTKILNHYRFYEIGSETIGRFLFNLESAMNLIMPYYNQLYKSIDVMNGLEDIFGNLDIVESFEQETSGSSSSEGSDNVKGTSSSDTRSESTSQNSTNSEVSSEGRTANSTTPQSQLKAKTLNQLTAASDMGWNENVSDSKASSDDKANTESHNDTNSEQETTSRTNAESLGTTKHTLTRKGNQGVNTYAHDMLEFRELFLKIEQQIINDKELASCFMLIW